MAACAIIPGDARAPVRSRGSSSRLRHPQSTRLIRSRGSRPRLCPSSPSGWDRTNPCPNGCGSERATPRFGRRTGSTATSGSAAASLPKATTGADLPWVMPGRTSAGARTAEGRSPSRKGSVPASGPSFGPPSRKAWESVPLRSASDATARRLVRFWRSCRKFLAADAAIPPRIKAGAATASSEARSAKKLSPGCASVRQSLAVSRPSWRA